MSALRNLYILSISFIAWMLGHPAHGVEIMLPGINIEEILTSNSVDVKAEVPADAMHLDVMLQDYPFSASVIDEQVAVTLATQPNELSDTDESILEEDRDISMTRSFKFASKLSTPQFIPLLTPTEIDYNQEPTKMTESLCRKLAKDAFSIANAHHNARTREATTCLCVVLRDKEKRPKKFIFHNSSGEMQPSMRKKADDLAYSIRNAHLAHAEVQFIEFLIHRAQQYTHDNKQPDQTRYTHILGMGCSRKHCQECDALCKLFLGHGYCRFTASMEKLNNKMSVPVIEACVQEDEADLQVIIPETVQRFKVVFQENAMRVGSNQSANYRLLETMRAAIHKKVGYATILNLTAARFYPASRISAQQLTEATLPPAEEAEAIDISSTQKKEITEAAVNTKEKKRKVIP